MSKIQKSILDLVGHTPLIEIPRYSKAAGIEGVKLLAKVEYFNPTGSSKDRVALAMIEDAEQKGLLKPGSTVIEPTSGNTGIGLAAVASVKGYKTIITLPETMSLERRAKQLVDIGILKPTTDPKEFAKRSYKFFDGVKDSYTIEESQPPRPAK